MHIFYTPDIVNSPYFLGEEESKHCIKVLRLKKGDTVYLVDGKGNFFTTEILEDHPKKCGVEIVNVTPNYGKRSHYLHVAIAPTKNMDRFEWFLEKATEIGIDEITPIICTRSERKELKIDRLNKVIESAMKQSIKAYHPQLNEVTTFKKFLSNNFEGNKFIAHGEATHTMTISHHITTVLIGPEGDFTSEELLLAEKNNFIPITLGKSRLRTETAGITTCVEFNYLTR